jgi:hypothetical protein
MPLSTEQKVAELRQGITDAPVATVHNNKSCLTVLLGAVDELRGSKSLSADHEKAVAEVRANVEAGASVVANSRATLLVVFDAIDELKKDAPKKPEPLEDSFKV